MQLLKNKNLQDKIERDKMQFKGDGNQVMLLKQEIQNGRVQGVNEIDHLESVFQ
jgi:hypothetical protein|tara:strand:+ start:128 stop:289 length:162 start_codon:yes stop_codon:yes gene_type:complete